jgi:hypothetical protein
MEEDDVRWYITPEGRKLIEKGVKGKKIGAEKKVPNEILDPALRAFKALRAYGLEEYTDEDMKEFRSRLPKEYHDVGLDDLRGQNVARRKQGCFADPEEKRRKSMQKILREFGPTGTVIKDFLGEEQVSDLYSRLGNNSASEEDE